MKDTALGLFAVAVAGPALVVAGARFPGTWTARLLLMGTGAALIASHYPQLAETARGSLQRTALPQVE